MRRAGPGLHEQPDAAASALPADRSGWRDWHTRLIPIEAHTLVQQRGRRHAELALAAFPAHWGWSVGTRSYCTSTRSLPRIGGGGATLSVAFSLQSSPILSASGGCPACRPW
jgi:hypothetical protein